MFVKTTLVSTVIKMNKLLLLSLCVVLISHFASSRPLNEHDASYQQRHFDRPRKYYYKNNDGLWIEYKRGELPEEYSYKRFKKQGVVRDGSLIFPSSQLTWLQLFLSLS